MAMETVGTFLGAKQLITSQFIFSKFFLAAQVTVKFTVGRD